VTGWAGLGLRSRQVLYPLGAGGVQHDRVQLGFRSCEYRATRGQDEPAPGRASLDHDSCRSGHFPTVRSPEWWHM